jgi:hypothetical protein
MPSPPKFQLVLHHSGLWEASAVVDREELHFGFFADQAEAQRTLDAAAARFGGEPVEPEQP